MYKTLEQLSIFIENKPGQLLSITSKLEENNISIISIMLSDSSEFGILRVLTKDYQKAKDILLNSGFSAKLTSVIGVKLKNDIGSFNKVVHVLSQSNINILYTYTVNEKNEGIFIFKVEERNLEKACGLLLDNKVMLAGYDDLA